MEVTLLVARARALHNIAGGDFKRSTHSFIFGRFVSFPFAINIEKSMWATSTTTTAANNVRGACASRLKIIHASKSIFVGSSSHRNNNDGMVSSSCAPRVPRALVLGCRRRRGGGDGGVTRLAAASTRGWNSSRVFPSSSKSIKRPPLSSLTTDAAASKEQPLDPTLTLDPTFRGLIAMVEEAGGWVHPSLRVGRRGGAAHGARGVFAADPIPRGVLLILPNDLRITAGAAEGKASLAKTLLLRRREALAAADADADDNDAVGGGGDAFIASLPEDGGGLPLLWSEDEVAALEHPSLEAAILGDQAAAKAKWVALGELEDDGGGGGGEMRGGFTLREWLWATATVSSRTFVNATPSRDGDASQRGGGGKGQKNKKSGGKKAKGEKGGSGDGGDKSGGKARTRRKGRIAEESGMDDGVETFAMEPLVDLLNHAPFSNSVTEEQLGGGAGGAGGAGAGGTFGPGELRGAAAAAAVNADAADVDAEVGRRNTLHSYLPPGSEPGTLEHLGEAAGASGAAVLYALRPLAAGEELLISYRDATATGALNTEESLRNYGFLSFADAPPDFAAAAAAAAAADDDDDDLDEVDEDDLVFFAGGAGHEADEAEERNNFAEIIVAVLGAPGGADLSAEQLLQVALCCRGQSAAAEYARASRDVAAAAAAAEHGAGSPTHTAARYRRARGASLARAALALLPERGAGPGLTEGVRLGACDAQAAGYLPSSGAGADTSAFQRRFLALLTAAV